MDIIREIDEMESGGENARAKQKVMREDDMEGKKTL